MWWRQVLLLLRLVSLKRQCLDRKRCDSLHPFANEQQSPDESQRTARLQLRFCSRFSSCSFRSSFRSSSSSSSSIFRSSCCGKYRFSSHSNSNSMSISRFYSCSNCRNSSGASLTCRFWTSYFCMQLKDSNSIKTKTSALTQKLFSDEDSKRSNQRNSYKSVHQVSFKSFTHVRFATFQFDR